MKEYWEITHTRAVATQAVWSDQPSFELNKLTKAQHAALTASLPDLAQARANKENFLTAAITFTRGIFDKLVKLGTRVPGMIEGLLDDEDPLKPQLDAIYAIDVDASREHTLRRARLLLPLWKEVDQDRLDATPAKAPLKLKLGDTEMGQADLKTLVDQGVAAQEAQAAKEHDLTSAKTALRTADRQTDRGNKRWYKAWLKAFPAGTAEGDAALAQIPTEDGGAADPEALEITLLTPKPDHTILVAFDPAGGKHATTRELLYRLPGETEFGHTAPITGASMVAGPFAAGAVVTFRTRVANSNPGTVPSAEKSAVVV